MTNNITKSKVVSGILWKLLEGTGTQGAQFIIQIVLARLLSPDDYSVIAITIIFITIANVFIHSGFSSALIQKREADEIDFSSVFYVSLFTAGLLYMILFFTAPYIATFYQNSQITPVLRILGITLLLGAVNSIQKAYIARNMLFKKLFLSSLSATIISGTIGIILAFHGFGVWALVAQQLVNQLLVNFLLFIMIKWRPIFKFSVTRVKVLFAYGSKLLASALIDTFYNNIRSLMIGKLYSPTMLSFYHRGDQFPSLIIGNINGSIQSVMLPALASQQDKSQKVKEMVRRSIITSTFLVFPMMVGLAAIAEPFVRFLLTDKWLPSVPFIRILSISYALWPIHTANLQAINAMGRSDLFLKLEIVKKIIGMLILIISIRFGVYAIVWGTLITGIIASFLNAYPNSKLLNYSYKEQWKDIFPGFILSLIMGLLVYGITWLNMESWITLIVQVISGIVLYLLMAIIFGLESYTYLLTMAKEFLERKKLQRKEGVFP